MAFQSSKTKPIAIKIVPIGNLYSIALIESCINILLKEFFLKDQYNYYKDYISKFNKGKIIEYPGNHWGFYLYSPEKITEKALEFLKESKILSQKI